MLKIPSHCSFKEHRSGWDFVIENLRDTLCDEKCGNTLLIDFIEKTWGWDLPTSREENKDIFFGNQSHLVPSKSLKSLYGSDVAKLDDGTIVVYRGDEWEADSSLDYESLPPPGIVNEPFVAFLHNPPNIPYWFDYQNSPQEITKRQEFIDSLRNCEGIFVLSTYLKEWLESNLGIPCPVNVLMHPTAHVDQFNLWSPGRFLSNREPCIVQVGYWLRRLGSIYEIDMPSHWRRVWLYGNPRAMDLLAVEAMNDDRISKEVLTRPVELHRLNNHDYDALLSAAIVLIDLYDSSCNNAIIECIVRETPALVKRIPATEEYLGHDYPLLFNTLQEASELARDFRNILQAHEHMKRLRLSGKFSGNTFVSDFKKSFIYRKISGSIEPIRQRASVSLGVDCFPRAMLTKYGFKKRHTDGEVSTPFDLAFHPPHIIIEMIYRNFQGFWEAPDLSFDGNNHIIHRNGSVYNHESDTDIKRRVFSENGFLELRERYNRRSRNFTNILSSSEAGTVVFVYMGNRYPTDLRDAIRMMYPSLDFHILTLNLLWAASDFRDTQPNVEYGTIESANLGFSFYNVKRPFQDYLWYNPEHFSSPEGKDFEEHIAKILGRVVSKVQPPLPPSDSGLEA